MSTESSRLHWKPILSVNIRQEQDVVTARQRARQISSALGFVAQDQTRISTTVSEICRNAYQYAGCGRLEFSIDAQARPQSLWIQISDQGPGIRNLESILSGAYISRTGMGVGLRGASKLMDQFEVSSTPEQGTTVRFAKTLPNVRVVETSDVTSFCASLSQQPSSGAAEELQQQNRDLLQTLETLRVRETELERRQRELSQLNLELEETNRGVLALYAELDEKASALRQADEMKTRFLSHVSHEFRTPLNAVLGLTALLLRRTDGDLLPEQELQVTYIKDAAQQLTEMVNDLLDLAKVDAGKTELRSASIDVAQFLGAMRGLMRSLVPSDAVTLTFEEPAEPLVIESDESKLGQILRNLISNALKYTQRGEVRVSAAVLAAEQSIVFKVKDTGIGVGEEDQERIFHEFAQVEHPIQKNVKGTGLGLPLSRRLAALLNGTLTVESQAGLGSIFTLTLPLQVGSSQVTDVAAPSSARLHEQGRTIMLVDDDVRSLYLAHRLFEGTNYRLVEVKAMEAREKAKTLSPALILLDLTMPERSGFEILEDLKGEEATQSIPVMIHSSRTLTEADYQRLGDRQAGVLPKMTGNRLAALRKMREILGEPELFALEAEFTGSQPR